MVKDIASEDIKITFNADTEPEEGTETLSHFHIYYELQFVLEGSCIFGNESSARIAKKNDLVVIPPHAVHYVKPCEESFSRFVAGVSISKRDKGKSASDYKKIYKQLSSLDSITVVRCGVGELIREATRHFNPKSTTGELYRQHFLMMLLLKATDAVGGTFAEETLSEGYSPEVIIDRYISDISGNPSACMKELSGMLNLSEKQTERLVRRLTGTTLKTLILRQRMNIAMELLKTTDYPISDIAIRSGYNSYDVFFKAFCKYYGQKPGSVRKGVSF